MLKLRKNKKGFTLVELIVVIAIMAVLAGTVAGVTVTQLNKNTDKSNATQAKGIADFISTSIIDEGFDIGAFKMEGDKKIYTFSITETKGTNEKTLKDLIVAQYSGVITKWEEENTVKGSFGITFEEGVINVNYKGKQASGGDTTYTINEEGVVAKA